MWGCRGLHLLMGQRVMVGVLDVVRGRPGRGAHQRRDAPGGIAVAAAASAAPLLPLAVLQQ